MILKFKHLAETAIKTTWSAQVFFLSGENKFYYGYTHRLGVLEKPFLYKMHCDKLVSLLDEESI